MIPDNDAHERIGGHVSDRNGAWRAAPPSIHSLVNVIPVEINAIHQGLLNVGIRVRIGEKTDLRIRWPLGTAPISELRSGQSVRVVIPAEAVHLEAGYFRLRKRRWNRWIGRIVLIETLNEQRVVSVKIHNDVVTLRCSGTMVGATWIPQLWDTVNIVVDPTKISLDLGMRQGVAPAVNRNGGTFDPFHDVRVWLRAQVTDVGEAPEGRVLSLLIGTARVAVFLGRENDSFCCWAVGMTLDIHVGRYDAWLKPRGSECAPVSCGLLYLDSQSLAAAR